MLQNFVWTMTQKDKLEGKTNKDWEPRIKIQYILSENISIQACLSIINMFSTYNLWTKLESLSQKKTLRNKGHLVTKTTFPYDW